MNVSKDRHLFVHVAGLLTSRDYYNRLSRNSDPKRSSQPDDIRINTWLGTNERFYMARSSRDLKRNKSFGRSMDRIDRLAQFGFLVVTVGNRGGHPARSKWYHTYGYGNLRDYGLADKKAAAEQLADRHPFIDINRVGITGHSGGGFMSTAAMLVYPDFFKVAVSGAGNHENNIYNRWWSERHHGVTEKVSAKGDTTFSYAIGKNTALAKNLKGRLLLATGDIDNNVHPANTIRMAAALIKANKRFDFLLLPGQRHGFGSMTEYFFWKMGDYFCEHLLGDYRDEVNITEINKEVPQN